MENNDALAFLGLARRAGKLAVGADEASAMCSSGKARLVVMSSDVAGNTKRWLEQAAQAKEIPLVPLSCTKDELGGALGAGGCACAAVCDTGFAISLCRKLGLNELEESLKDRQQREKRRKAKKLAGKGKADISKRGN